MVLAKDSVSGEETLYPKDTHDPTTDEAEETLSLCDLQLYNDQSAEWEEDLLSSESQGSSSMSSSDNDYFEFSQELNPSATGFPQENIIFCGKLITYRHPPAPENESSMLVDSTNQMDNQKRQGRGWGRRLFGWKVRWIRSDGKRSIGTAIGHKQKDHPSSPLHESSPKKVHRNNKRNGFRVHKLSMLTPSSSWRGKCYLFLFGISRFSSQVELRDIKSRQSRRQFPSPYSSPIHCDDKVREGGNRSWGLWSLIRALSCATGHTLLPPSQA